MQFVGMQFAWKHVFFLFSRGQNGMSNRTARSHNEPGFFFFWEIFCGLKRGFQAKRSVIFFGVYKV